MNRICLGDGRIAAVDRDGKKLVGAGGDWREISRVVRSIGEQNEDLALGFAPIETKR